jgi:protein arginine kinase
MATSSHLKILCAKGPFGESPEEIILTSRLRLARNIDKYSFPGWAKKEKRLEILEVCKKALMKAIKKAYFFEMSTLSDLEKKVLVERHLISRELTTAAPGAAVIINTEQSIAAMINEEDHLRIQSIRGGLDFKKTWKLLDAIDTNLEESLSMAFSKELGYLTACPTNIGTAIRASAMLHLPGLVLSGNMEKVVRAVNQLGIAVRGLFGEGSEATGSIFQISNQQTLGETEIGIIERIEGVLKAIIEQERNSRLKLLEEEQERFLDKIGRAYGMLQNCRTMNASEAMAMLSLMRLAVDMGYLPEQERTFIDKLFLEIQPGHLQFLSKELVNEQQRDNARAKMLRNHFSGLPPLSF